MIAQGKEPASAGDATLGWDSQMNQRAGSADVAQRTPHAPHARWVFCTPIPLSGNLDRIQIIKGWMDSDGETHEKVYDVTWGGDRKPGPDGKLPPVGNTVNVEKAIWTNSIGAAELSEIWTDPDFDPKEPAFYYARVIEIPTPRWTAYEAKRFGVKMPKEVPMTTQERAYTSPIWYTPPAGR